MDPRPLPHQLEGQVHRLSTLRFSFVLDFVVFRMARAAGRLDEESGAGDDHIRRWTWVCDVATGESTA